MPKRCQAFHPYLADLDPSAQRTMASTYPKHETISYSDDSSLNTISIHLPSPPKPNDPSRLWLIYIHGGAWRDPSISASSFEATQKHLLASRSASNIAGIASLNYRLSPYPHHPSNPSSPHDPARNARHPDHVNDVLAAILHLQETYHFNDRYILIGHSCGATLALQVAMRRYWGSQYESTLALELNVEPPLAIIGSEGIYDIPALVAEYSSIPAYRDFVANAFGPDEATWKGASPSQADFDESWPDGRMVVLMHSVDDELVSLKQPERMLVMLKEQGWEEDEGSQRRVKLVKAQGLKHDEVWQDGEVLAGVSGKVIDELLP